MRSFRSATSYFCQLSGSQQQPGGWKSTIYTKTTRMYPGKDITQHRMANPPQVFIKKQRVSLRWGLVIANMMTRPPASKTHSIQPAKGRPRERRRQAGSVAAQFRQSLLEKNCEASSKRAFELNVFQDAPRCPGIHDLRVSEVDTGSTSTMGAKITNSCIHVRLRGQGD